MNKKSFSDTVVQKRYLQKHFFRIMRTTAFLLFLFVFCLSAENTNSQNVNVTLKSNNIELEKVLNEIEKQTDFLFVYNNHVNVNRIVSVNLKKASLERTLENLFKGTNVKYSIDGTYILLSANEPNTKSLSTLAVDQQLKRTISGTIKDEKGEPIVGANVVEKGTTNGTITDMNGKFSISVEKRATLNVSYIGYLPQNILVGEKKEFNIQLIEDTQKLEEVVVVGYGSQKKVNLTGAVDYVAAEEISRKAVTNTSQALQGILPNVNVTFSDGRPNAKGDINVRGNTSINGGNPLILIDGIQGDINAINPKDIQSISVLKDAASASIYGARGAFGVILITTKEATDGKIAVQYSNNFGWSSPTINTHNFMTDGYEWVKINDEARMVSQGASYTGYSTSDMAYFEQRTKDSSLPDVAIDNRGGKNLFVHYGNTDWWHEFFTDVQPSMEHNINLSGGTDKLNFYLSGRYYNKKGIYKIVRDVFDSYTIRNRINVKPFDWLKVSNTINYFSSVYNYPTTNKGANPWTNFGYHASPSYHPVNPDGSFLINTGLNGYNIADGTFADLMYGKSMAQDKEYEFTNTTAVQLDLMKGLTLNADFTFKRNSPLTWERRVKVPYTNQPDGVGVKYYGNDLYIESSKNNIYKVFNAYANYSAEYGKHLLEGVIGFNQELQTYKWLKMQRDDLLTENLNAFNLATGNNISLNGTASEWAVRGLFYRAKYNFNNKYLLEFNGRYDLTSRFPKNSRSGFFPSVSAAWRISEESFWKDLKSTISNLKVRVSYGSLGNQDVDTYAYISSMTMAKSDYIVDDQKSEYFTTPAVVSSNLTWEEARTIDFGIDFSAFDSRFTASYDRYVRNTVNMLTTGKTLPLVFGADEPKENASDLRTKGFELKLGWQDRINLGNKPFSYSINFSLSDYTSKITRFDNPNKYLGDYYKGQTLGDIWGYTVEGFFATDDEYLAHANQKLVNSRITSSPIGHPVAGDVKFLDVDGNGEIDYGKYTLEDHGDLKVIGNLQPRYAFGIELGANYSSFDINVFFQGIAKQNWWPGRNNGLFWGPWSRPYHSFIPKDIMKDSWTSENTDAYLPRLFGFSAHDVGSGYTGSQLGVYSDKYLQDVGYIRLKSIVFGYTLPISLSKRMKMKSARIYCNGTNLLTFSKLYKHNSHTIDPEQLGDGNGYPFTKTISVGIDVKF